MRKWRFPAVLPQAVLRIREFILDRGSEFFHLGSSVKNIPGTRIWIHEVFEPHKLLLSSRKYDPRSGSWFFTHPESRIQGSKRDRSRIRIRNTAHKFTLIRGSLVTPELNRCTVFGISRDWLTRGRWSPPGAEHRASPPSRSSSLHGWGYGRHTH